MRTRPPAPDTMLINTPQIELWPAALLTARSNRDARALAHAHTVLRRKRDGTYLAAVLPHGLLPLVPRLMREAGIDAALDALDALHHIAPRRGRRDARPHRLPRGSSTAVLATMQVERLAALGIDATAYTTRTGLPPVPEPDHLTLAGRDRYRRALWLHAGTALAWQRMRRAAFAEGVSLDAISGYRSHAHQSGIVERKRARGLPIDEILTVNAAPGFSEHHSGRAIDIGTEGEPPAEPTFEHTDAFAWLHANANAYGFTMSYPRDNPHGIVHEPWHWAYRGP